LQQVKRDFQADGMDIFTADVRTFLGRQTDLPQVVFADPPYDLPWLKELPSLIFEKKTEQFQLLIIEHGKDIKFEDSPYFWQTRSYGHVHFSFFKIENK
jgi:16S rRNA G966 N2-methylase RsmD